MQHWGNIYLGQKSNFLDFFEDEMNESESNRAFFTNTFGEYYGIWVCPDTSQLTLLNTLTAISALVYSCDHAVSDYGGYQQAYGGESCLSYDDTQSSFSDHTPYYFNTRQISQYFSPTTYLSTGSLSYYAGDPVETKATSSVILY